MLGGTVKKALLLAAGLAFAAISLAQLSKYKDWGKSAEAYFLTPSEKEAWSKVSTDADAEKFIADYWAKRDPNPATSANEFRDEVGRRIAAADDQFKMRNKRGSETNRGRLLVTLGLPTRVSTERSQEGAVQDSGGLTAPSIDTRASTFESGTVVITTWTYGKEKFDPSLQIGELRVRMNIDPQRGTDDLMAGTAAEKAIAKVAEKSIVNPSATTTTMAAVAPAVPAAATGAPAAPAPAPAPAAASPPAPAAPAASAGRAAAVAALPPPASAPSTTLPAEVRSALEGLTPTSRAEGAFWAGDFRTITGEPFYAFQFYVPNEKAVQGLKFGGVVWNEANQPVGSYWEDASLVEVKSGSRTDKAFDRSIALPVGSYRGAFGLFPASGGAPVATAAATFKLESHPNEFGVSPLILANTLTPLTKRPSPTDPFVFGMEKPIKVEPKADRKFAKEDSLWYFYAVSNPTSAAGTATPPAPATTPGAAAAAPAAEPKPRIMTRISVLRDGKDAFQPLTSPAELQPLAPRYYASGSEIPLASFEPGYYTFGIQVRDMNAPRDSAAYKGVERKEDFVVLNPDGSLPSRAAAKTAPKPKAPAKKP
jgi:GWxTD domain-containing protein